MADLTIENSVVAEDVESSVVTRFLVPDDVEVVWPYFEKNPSLMPDLHNDLVVGQFDKDGKLVGIAQAKPTFVLANLMAEAPGAVDEIVSLLNMAIGQTRSKEYLVLKVPETGGDEIMRAEGYKLMPCEVWGKKVV